MESLHQHQGQKHYEGYKLLKDVLHRPRQRSLDELRKIKYQEFLEKPLGRIIHLQTLEKKRQDLFGAAETATRIDRQTTLDGGSQAQRSVVSFPLCRPTEAQHPFHFKSRDPLSRHQRSHHLFWQVL